MFEVLGFRGLGFRVSGFRVETSFKKGLGFRVLELWFGESYDLALKLAVYGLGLSGV